MKTIERDKVKELDYKEILEKEVHHRHPLIQEEDGTIRWKGNKSVGELVNKANLNNIMALFYHMGYDKNSEVVRKLYRDLGVSLSLYWEVFYWEVNNEEAAEYNPLSGKFDI